MINGAPFIRLLDTYQVPGLAPYLLEVAGVLFGLPEVLLDGSLRSWAVAFSSITLPVQEPVLGVVEVAKIVQEEDLSVGNRHSRFAIADTSSSSI